MKLLGGMVAALLVAAAPAKDEVAVVVAVRDIAAGEVVTFEDIAQARVAKKLVTASSVKADSASYIVNQKLNLPVLKGDVLYWSFFETSKASLQHARCAAFGASGGTPESQVARARQIALLHVK